MKRGASCHPRTEELAAVLGISVAHAMGILEMLCNHFAPEFAPQGDVGKWSDVQIVRGLKADIDPAVLIAALVDVGVLERVERYRLVIHDYHEHADNLVRRWLQRHHLWFVTAPPGDLGLGSDTSGADKSHTFSAPPARGSGRGSGSEVLSSSSSGDPDPEHEACNVVELFPLAREEDGPADFEDFWAEYPKKVAKLDARRAFAKLRATRGLLRQMAEALAWQRGSPQWLKDGGQMIPYPASWLNGRRWEDEPIDMPDLDETTVSNGLAMRRFKERMRDADGG